MKRAVMAAVLCAVVGFASSPRITVSAAAVASAAASEEVSVDETVLADRDGVKVTLKSFDGDGFLGPEFAVLIENNGDAPVCVQARDASINGVMAEPMLSCSVAPGKKANDTISFMSSELDAANIEVIKELELKLHVFDDETWDVIFDTEAIHITTSADPGYVQEFDETGTLLLEQDGVKIIARGLDEEDSLWGADLYLYIANDSGQDITVQARDVSVNGFMIDGIFSCDVVDGKKAFDTVSFFENDLEENGITGIDEIELSFHVFNTQSWDTLFDSDVVSITFLS